RPPPMPRRGRGGASSRRTRAGRTTPSGGPAGRRPGTGARAASRGSAGRGARPPPVGRPRRRTRCRRRGACARRPGRGRSRSPRAEDTAAALVDTEGPDCSVESVVVVQTGLLEQARGGDLDAFEALLAPLIEPACQLAYSILRDWQEAEDAAQE